ncbi:MAG TPA: hypothetical protein VKG38_18270 [Solirubrobacteraceae bacterium]|nr:hypothetical protein [Solirubrobacteraceae bacterium]
MRGRRHPPRVLLALGAIAVAATLGGCGGESKEQKAQKTVCSARADIKTRVEHLRTLTPSVQALTELRDDAGAIAADLKKMTEAQKDLSPARRQELQQATSKFEQQATEVFNNLTRSSSTTQLLTALTGALHQLAAAYNDALAPLTCT